MNSEVQAIAINPSAEDEKMSHAPNDTNSTPIAIVQASKLPEDEPKKRKPRLLYVALGCAVLVVILVVVGLVVGLRPTSTSASEASEQVDKFGCKIEQAEPDSRRLQLNKGFEWIGCFQRQSSVDILSLDDQLNQQSKAQVCSEHCFTRHFGVADSTCYCYAEAPESRLSIGSCGSVCSVALDQRMETYFKMAVDETCNQETTTAVRNFLVEEDDTPFGFDIITNEFRSSPFELYKDECGTNIYEVQTEISAGSNELTTTTTSVTKFASERRSSLSSSIKTSASFGRKGLFVSASAKVSASLDQEQNSMFKSSGANSVGSRVYTSVGVKRLAEVKLPDFENKKHFVTFSPQFGSGLRSYKASGYKKEVAQEIFKTYGMFVMERGIFGGFMQLQTTVKDEDFSQFFSSEEDSRRCFEAAVSGKASGFGFKGSFSVQGSGCSEEAAKAMRDLESSYSQETSAQSVVGGKIQNGEFIVSPEFSTLLTTTDKYPAGDNGIQLRLLTEFLTADKISPLEVKRLLLTETDFGEIKQNLEQHMLEELQAVGLVVDQCGDCDLPYLQYENGELGCACYDPEEVMCQVSMRHVSGGRASDGSWSLNNLFAFDNNGSVPITNVNRLTGYKAGGVTLEFTIPPTVNTLAFASQDAKSFDVKVTGCGDRRKGPGIMNAVHWSNSQYRDGGDWTAEHNNIEEYWSYNVVRLSSTPKSEFLPWSKLPF